MTAPKPLRGNGNDIEDARGRRWEQSLGDGPAATALLRLEHGQDPREALTTMLASPILAHPDQVGLFDGAPAAAFTLAATGYHGVFAVLDRHVQAITRARLATAHARIDVGELPVKREFDLISGLGGLAAYLLRRDTHPGTDPADARGGLLGEVLAYLVALTRTRPDGLPGWWAAGGPTGPGPRWAGGHGNLGLAHGISGVLAVLALAMRRGITVAGQAEAIDTICRWLDRWRCGTGHQAWWPEAITRDEHIAGVARPGHPSRPSWCYGTPGITHALHLAGLALDDPRRRRSAAATLAWTLADETQLAQLSDVSVCHGWAGVLHTARRMAEHDEQVRAHVPQLAAQLTQHHARHRQRTLGRHGLLTGDAGVQLVQHAATTNTAPVTRWDACLLLDA